MQTRDAQRLPISFIFCLHYYECDCEANGLVVVRTRRPQGRRVVPSTMQQAAPASGEHTTNTGTKSRTKHKVNEAGDACHNQRRARLIDAIERGNAQCYSHTGRQKVSTRLRLSRVIVRGRVHGAPRDKKSMETCFLSFTKPL